MILARDIQFDQSKIEVIQTWLQPKMVMKLKSFHGLASFYWRLIKDFSSVVPPITECTKKGSFEWSKKAQKAFEKIKQRLCQAPFLALLNFEDLFELECDLSGVGIETLLIQSKRPVAYFSVSLMILGATIALMMRSIMLL